MIEKPKKREKAVQKPLRRIPIKKIGSVTKKWLVFRRQWIKENPPDWLGNYQCWVCGGSVPATAFDLDHVKERSTHPELRFDPENVRPSHPYCNQTRNP